MKKLSSLFVVALLAAVLLPALATSVWAATTIRGSKSNSSEKIKGLFVTASVNLTGPNDTQTVYTTPATGEVFLTAFCANEPSQGVTLSVAGLGSVALAGTTSSCVTFPSKVFLPPNATVTCSTGQVPAAGYFCSIMAIESSK